MPHFPYRLALAFTGPDKQDLGQHPIEADWVPAREAIQFDLIRLNGDRSTAIEDSHITLKPIFSAKLGEPWLEGVTAVAACDDREISLPLLNAAFVRSAARIISSRLVAEKKVESGELIAYRTLAYPIDEEPRSPRASSPFSEVAILPPVIESESLASVFPGAALASADHMDGKAESFPILVPDLLIAEIEASSEAADSIETGGLLLGRLHRIWEAGVPRLAAEITAQIPAECTEASGTSLRFTDESWAAADRALRLRKQAAHPQFGEIVIGWWHSHPARSWCPDACPLESRLSCPKQAAFFSADDLALHREVFPKAHHLALLVNVADAGTTVYAFASVRGIVEMVPYRVFPMNR